MSWRACRESPDAGWGAVGRCRIERAISNGEHPSENKQTTNSKENDLNKSNAPLALGREKGGNDMIDEQHRCDD